MILCLFIQFNSVRTFFTQMLWMLTSDLLQRSILLRLHLMRIRVVLFLYVYFQGASAAPPQTVG